MEMIIKKIYYVVLFIILSILIFPISLSTVKGINRLSNYNEIKGINVNRIYEKNGDYPVFNRENGITYIKGEKIPFDGIMVAKKNGNILGIYQYSNGKREKSGYDYYENGQLHIYVKNINGKTEGEGFEYYPNGKLKEKRFYKNNIVSEFIGYLQNDKLDRTFKQTIGMHGVITGYYEDGIHKSCEMNVIQDYSKRGETSYIKDGESIAYDKKGRVLGIINYKDNKTTGLKQQAFKNGKLKYEYISASDKLEDLKMQDYYIEYFDNSEQIKLNCNELSKGNWRCKEYSKNGNFKREFDSPTFRSPNDWSFGINTLLGIINILF